MEMYYEPRRMSRRPSYNPDYYYGGNSESKPSNIVNQEGGKSKKSKKSKKSRRSNVDYGSIMLYGGKSKKSRKSRKSRKSKN